MRGRGWPEASQESCPGDRGQKSLMHTDKENTPSTSSRDRPGGHWEATERQIGVAKPVSGKQASSAPGRRVMTSAPRQTLIEQKLIEINTPEDISTSWYELINSPVQSEILP